MALASRASDQAQDLSDRSPRGPISLVARFCARFPDFSAGIVGVVGALSASTFPIPDLNVRTIVASLCGLLAFIGWKYSIQPDDDELMWPEPSVLAHPARPRELRSVQPPTPNP